MKSVIVFDVENVLFNVNYVKGCLRRRNEKLSEMDEFEKGYGERSREKYYERSFKNVKMYGVIKDGVKDLMEIRRRIGGKVKVYVVSEMMNEWVWNLMKFNGLSVDGIYNSIGKFSEEVELEGKDVVYFSGIKDRVEEGKRLGVNSVMCKWGNKRNNKFEGIESCEEMLENVGIIKVESEKKEEMKEDKKIESVEVENKDIEVIELVEKNDNNSERVIGERINNEIEINESDIDWSIGRDNCAEELVERKIVDRVEKESEESISGNMEEKVNDPYIAA